ncbi:MAG: hypothetical protein SFU27_06875 [Thermonemataceae bacterium]|nr:hypothetical protein [Thermonemataceae bacterium]
MDELKILVEFIVAVVSAYFLMKIENVKQGKDVASLGIRVTKLEDKTEKHEKDVREDLQEIKEMVHQIQLKLVELNRR